MPFSDASFSRIIMVDALHHVRDQRRTAAELWRVLAPDGRIVIAALFEFPQAHVRIMED